MLQQSENRFPIDKPRKRRLQCHSLHMPGDPAVCPSVVRLKRACMSQLEQNSWVVCTYCEILECGICQTLLMDERQGLLVAFQKISAHAIPTCSPSYLARKINE